MDLTTLANVQAYGQIPASDTASAAILARLISSFSQWFLNQVNRGALVESDYTESRNGKGGDSLTLRYWPIQSIASLSVDGAAVPASAGLPGAWGYIFDDFTVWLVGYRFNRGRGNIQIAYTAGYPNVPLDVEQAVIQQVLFTFRQAPNLGSVSQSANGVLTAAFSQKDLAPGVQSVIDSYKSQAVVGV